MTDPKPQTSNYPDTSSWVVVLQEDDCAPDAEETFERNFLTLVGSTTNCFKEKARKKTDKTSTCWLLDNLELSSSADDSYYTLKSDCDAAKEVRVIAANEVELLRKQIAALRAKLNDVYSERNRLAAGFARMALMAGFKAGLLKGTLNGSEEHFVYVDTPNGQVSWYITDCDSDVLCGLPTYDGNWDKHYRAREKAWCVWDIKPAD